MLITVQIMQAWEIYTLKVSKCYELKIDTVLNKLMEIHTININPVDRFNINNKILSIPYES